MSSKKESYEKWSAENALLNPSTEEAFSAGWDAHALSDTHGAPVRVLWQSDITPEMIYDAYPRKVGKQAALKAIEKAMRQHSHEYLHARTMEYAAAVAKWPNDARFTRDGTDTVPHPSTWFNEGRYDDADCEWVRGSRTANARGETRIYTRE
jgi:hypothetical protein